MLNFDIIRNETHSSITICNRETGKSEEVVFDGLADLAHRSHLSVNDFPELPSHLWVRFSAE